MDDTELVAFVTGGTKGLGKVLCDFLSREGYRVFTMARHTPPKPSGSALDRMSGRPPEVLEGDVADPAARRRIRESLERWGRLDLLVNNASTLGPTPLPDLSAYPLDGLRQVLETNLIAPVALIQELRRLLESAQGLVVNVSSDAALGGYPGWGGYGASKAGLDLISKTLAQELNGSKVTVVSVDPGEMQTEMLAAAYGPTDVSDRPNPEATLPFWAWLLGQDRSEVSGRRFQAQSDRWELPA